MTLWRFAGGLAAVLAAVLVTGWLVTRWIAVPWVVDGPSMEPTLEPGDRVIVDVLTYHVRAPRPGEVALVDGPGGESLVKRLEGPSHAPGDGGEGYLVMGDNAGASLDSRAFGPVPVARIRGRIVYRYWPPSRAGAIR